MNEEGSVVGEGMEVEKSSDALEAELIAAAGEGRSEGVRELLLNDLDPRLAIERAVYARHRAIADALLDYLRCKLERPPLDSAAGQLLCNAPAHLDRLAFWKTLKAAEDPAGLINGLLADDPERLKNAWRLRIAAAKEDSAKISDQLKALDSLDLELMLEFAAEDDLKQIANQILTSASGAVVDRSKALAIAAFYGRAEVVIALLDDAPESIDRAEAICAALLNDHEDIVNLVMNGAEEGIQQAWKFMVDENEDEIQALLDGDTLNRELALALAVILGEGEDYVEDIGRLLVSDSEIDFNLAIRAAIFRRNPVILEYFLPWAPRFSVDFRTAIPLAHGQQEIADLLWFICYQELNFAARSDDENALEQAMARAPANIDRPRFQSSLKLETAVYNSDEKTVDKLLMEAAEGLNYDYALSAAATLGRYSIVCKLLAGPPFSRLPLVDAITRAQDAITRAQEEEYPAIVNLLTIHLAALQEDGAANTPEEKVSASNALTKVLKEIGPREAIFLATLLNQNEMAAEAENMATDGVEQALSLRAAVEENNEDEIDELLSDPDLDHALALALVVGLVGEHSAIIGRLLQQENCDRALGLEVAVSRNDAAMVGVLLRGAPASLDRKFALMAAVRQANAPIVAGLFSGAPLSIALALDSLVYHAQQKGNWEIADILIDHFQQALEIAATNGYNVARLLENEPLGADRARALLHAAENGHTEIVKQLLENVPIVNVKYETYVKALVVALANDHDGIAELVAGAADEAVRKVWTLISAAKREDGKAVAQSLTDPNLDHSAALAVAVAGGQRALVDRLLAGHLNHHYLNLAIQAAITKRDPAMTERLLEVAPFAVNFRDMFSLVGEDDRATADMLREACDRQIVNAVLNGGTPAIAQALAISPADIDRHRPLYLAAASDQPGFDVVRAEIIHILMEGAAAGVKNALALWRAVKENNTAEINSLLEDSDLDPSLALALVIDFGGDHEEIINQLWTREGIDLSLALEAAVYRHDVATVDKLLAKGAAGLNRTHALTAAVAWGEYAVVKKLLAGPRLSSRALGDAITKAYQEKNYAVTNLLLIRLAAPWRDGAPDPAEAAGAWQALAKFLQGKDPNTALAIAAVLDQEEMAAEAAAIAPDDVKKAWALRVAILEGRDEEGIGAMLADPGLNVDWALALVVNLGAAHRTWLDRLLSLPGDIACNYALPAAVVRRDADAVGKLLRGVSAFLDWRHEIEYARNEAPTIADLLTAHFTEALEAAVKKGDRAGVGKLLNVAPYSADLRSALTMADGEMAALLAAHLGEALQIAAKDDRRERFATLCSNAPASLDRRPVVYYCIGRRDVEPYGSFVAKAAEGSTGVEKALLLRAAVEENNEDKINELLSDPVLDHALALALVIGLEGDVGAIIGRLLQQENCDRALGLEVAVSRNDAAMVGVLLSGAPASLDRKFALMAAVRQANAPIVAGLFSGAPLSIALALDSLVYHAQQKGNWEIADILIGHFQQALKMAITNDDSDRVARLLQSNLGSQYYEMTISDALLSNHDGIAELAAEAADEAVRKAWALISAAKREDGEAIEQALADPSLDRSRALGFAVAGKQGAIVDRLLAGPQEGLDRAVAMTRAVSMGDLAMVKKLLQGAPPSLRLVNAIQYANDMGHQEIASLLSKQNTINHFTLSRPSFNALSPAEEEVALKKRLEWIGSVISQLRDPELIVRVMPPFSDVASLWSPKGLAGDERQAMTQRFAAFEETCKDQDNFADFAAVICLAESLPQFRLDEPNDRAAIWDLLMAALDKNCLKLPNGEFAPPMSDDDHAELRVALFGNAQEALGACADRLSNGVQGLEVVVLGAVFKHLPTTEERMLLMRGTYIDEMKKRIAELMAAAFWLDGYRFPQEHVFAAGDPRATERYNPGGEVDIKSVLDQRLGPDYLVRRDRLVITQFEDSVAAWARDAQPVLYGSKTNAAIAEAIVEQAKAIIDGWLADDLQPSPTWYEGKSIDEIAGAVAAEAWTRYAQQTVSASQTDANIAGAVAAEATKIIAGLTANELLPSALYEGKTNEQIAEALLEKATAIIQELAANELPLADLPRPALQPSALHALVESAQATYQRDSREFPKRFANHHGFMTLGAYINLGYRHWVAYLKEAFPEPIAKMEERIRALGKEIVDAQDDIEEQFDSNIKLASEKDEQGKPRTKSEVHQMVYTNWFLRTGREDPVARDALINRLSSLQSLLHEATQQSLPRLIDELFALNEAKLSPEALLEYLEVTDQVVARFQRSISPEALPALERLELDPKEPKDPDLADTRAALAAEHEALVGTIESLRVNKNAPRQARVNIRVDVITRRKAIDALEARVDAIRWRNSVMGVLQTLRDEQAQVDRQLRRLAALRPLPGADEGAQLQRETRQQSNARFRQTLAQLNEFVKTLEALRLDNWGNQEEDRWAKAQAFAREHDSRQNGREKMIVGLEKANQLRSEIATREREIAQLEKTLTEAQLGQAEARSKLAKTTLAELEELKHELQIWTFWFKQQACPVPPEAQEVVKNAKEMLMREFPQGYVEPRGVAANEKVKGTPFYQEGDITLFLQEQTKSPLAVILAVTKAQIPETVVLRKLMTFLVQAPSKPRSPSRKPRG